MRTSQRARVHAALGDESRLELIELLLEGDQPVQELGTALAIPGNLLAHHLKVLEEAGVVERHQSEGDRRRRYVTLRLRTLEGLSLVPAHVTGPVFVCTHNSARSQYAAAYWRQRTGLAVESAGSNPASNVHPLAIRVAEERGLHLGKARPRGYDSLPRSPSVVISVCDRAREAGLPDAQRHLHWSVPDPVLDGRIGAFRSAFDDIEQRINAITP